MNTGWGMLLPSFSSRGGNCYMQTVTVYESRVIVRVTTSALQQKKQYREKRSRSRSKKKSFLGGVHLLFNDGK